MPDDVLERLVTDAVDHHRPPNQPAFEELETRWRRRRTTRRSALAVTVAAVVAAAVAVPATLVDRPHPPAATGVAPSRPAGPIPLDVTGVSACNGPECRTITDAGQLGLLVDDLNGSEPYPFTYQPQDPHALVVTLTFTGPNAPYPVVEVVANADWWSIRGTTQRYVGYNNVRQSALQAQRLGVVVHDCRVTSPYLGPESAAPEFVGLTLDEAQSLASQRKWTVRVLGQDGKCDGGPQTDDFRLDRVDLYLERGKVSSAARF